MALKKSSQPKKVSVKNMKTSSQKQKKNINATKGQSKLLKLLSGKVTALIFVLIFGALGAYFLIQSDARSTNRAVPFEDRPESGLVWAGLRSGKGDKLCENLLEVIDRAGEVNGCTHGPDPAPEGADIRQSVQPVAPDQKPESSGEALAACDGDGTTGYRVEAIYARASDKADRYDMYASSFQTWANNVDTIVNESAKQTNGNHRVRFVTNSSCAVSVHRVTLSTTGDDSFGNTVSELKAQGFNRTDRKYMIWVDATVYCGIGHLYIDDRPTQDNYNNGGRSMFARTDSGCWGGRTEAHELMHTLGGVQKTSPNTDGAGHCTDEYDRMCYGSNMKYLCASALEARFDCNSDDYFNANPPAGSYLANFWNTANNRFLISASTSTTTDTTAPTVSLTSPLNGATVSGTFDVTASASDNVSVSRVDFLVNGNVKAADSSAPYVYQWDTTQVVNGSYTLTAKAYDSSGNSTTSATITVNVSNAVTSDTTPPAVTISSPADGSTVQKNGKVYIAANSTDAVGVTKMQLYIDGKLISSTSSNSISYEWNARKASSGYHTITVKAFDAAGNIGQTQVTITKL